MRYLWNNKILSDIIQNPNYQQPTKTDVHVSTKTDPYGYIKNLYNAVIKELQELNLRIKDSKYKSEY